MRVIIRSKKIAGFLKPALRSLGNVVGGMYPAGTMKRVAGTMQRKRVGALKQIWDILKTPTHVTKGARKYGEHSPITPGVIKRNITKYRKG